MLFVEIIKIGFHGFAFVMLYLGYRLLNSVINNPGSGSNLKQLLTSTYIFMGISFLFFLTGAGIQIYSNFKPYTIKLSLTPELPKTELYPSVLNMNSNEVVTFKNPNIKIPEIKISNDQIIQMNVKNINDEISALTKSLIQLQQQNIRKTNFSEGGL